MIYMAMAAGWVLAAFLGGFIFGRSKHTGAERRAKKADKTQKSAIDNALEDQLKRELLNFLNYDGTEQAPE